MSISRIQAIETGNNVPKVDINSTKNNIPKVPVDLVGGSSPIDLQSITITENGTTEAPEGIAYNEVIVDVSTPTLTSISITENGTTEAPEGVAYNEVIVNVPQSLPDLELVCEYDFTSATPKKDKVRYNIEGGSNYITFDTTKGAVFDSASARFFNTYYNLCEGNSYKIEIEFGDIVLNESFKGKRNIFSYVPNTNTTNENSYSLGWDTSNNNFRYKTGAGDRTISKPVDYWKNDTMTIYYGLSVDVDGTLYLPSVYIDNSSPYSLIIMDKDLITHLTQPFVQHNPNFVLGGGNNFCYMEIKKFRIYRINNLIEKPVNLI